MKGGKPRKSSSAVVKKGAQASRALESATREIVRLKQAIGSSFYELGRVLARVRDERLYEAGGHATFEDYLDQAVEISRATAYKFIRVATVFSERFAVEWGADKLVAALRYIDATPEDEKPSDIPKLSIPVVSEDGKVTKKPIAKASVREIERASQSVSRKQHDRGERRAPASAEADRFVSRAKERLDAANLEMTAVDSEWWPAGKAHVIRVGQVKVANAWRTFEILAKVAREL